MNQPTPPRAAPAWLSGREAAAFLGVKRETLYAYASRGLVRSEPVPRGQGRRYRREDLVRLKARSDARAGHGPVAAGALRWGEPVLESALTALDEDGLRYRGHRVVDLAAQASFEAVAELLWTGSLPDEAPLWRAEGLGVRAAPLAALLPARCHPLTTLAVAVPAIAAGDAGRFDAAPEAERHRARALILRMAALLGYEGGSAAGAREAVQAGSVARATLLGFGVRPTARSEQAVNAALVLLADHELNASSFTVRIAASAKADLYACVSAGIATVSGPLHGGSCDRVEALVAEVGRPEEARAVIEARGRRGEAVPGFGHPLYPGGDPRAPPLIAAAAELGRGSGELATLMAIVDAMRDLRREAVNVDVGLVALATALGLRPGAAAGMFALGRVAGWVAHAFEQREAGYLLRPRARYVGPPARET